MIVDSWLSDIITRAAQKCGCSKFDPEIRPSDPKFGDFQANGILQYAKKIGQNPKTLAWNVIDYLLDDPEVSENIDLSLAGPGFINFKFKNKFLCDWLNKHSSIYSFKSDLKLFDGKKILVDYSSPNAAKQMHVGHLRSMNIGESICRFLSFCGAEVVRDNHIGDWGTQFGILIMAFKHECVSIDELPEDSALMEIERLYKLGSALAKQDEKYLNIARDELVKLQNGDKENFAMWKEINRISYDSFDKIYGEFKILFDYVLGESFYRDKVDEVYKSLSEIGIAEEDRGALVVFFKDDDKFKDQPFIIRKSDGASNYASTDLATVKYRVDALKSEEIIYVTDGRQRDHFQQLFMTIDRWFSHGNVDLPTMRHVWFGTILGEDGKAIKTRDGSPIYLLDLINEARSRAYKIVDEKNFALGDEEKLKIANIVGMGAIRYFDLAQNRTSDYLFSWKNMLSFDGNTAVYMLYAIARLHSILAKVDGGIHVVDSIETTEERSLIRKLIYFPIILRQVIGDLKPHYLCTYLFELASEYSSFYSANRILVGDESTRFRRLALCERTLLVLELGLNLLGIETLKKM